MPEQCCYRRRTTYSRRLGKVATVATVKAAAVVMVVQAVVAAGVGHHLEHTGNRQCLHVRSRNPSSRVRRDIQWALQ